MNYYIIVFKNTHDAMSAEQKLNGLNYDFRIMPTPTLITQSCGICIRVEQEEKLNEIIESKVIEFKNIYKKEDSKYILIK
ncbi:MULTISPECIES: DUF3343 domain-containing protein [unclassified Clostridium]|uniref:DUF3343 domain-containing protein n=1 Tax=Clostridium TaxID=1485 RepID=UPI001C8C7B17|nr:MULTISPECIES: DUF3343 domain-containing protein [unclassified Clostridium]MBX9138699.1 DUF3343 domain-containing protein [Clostridium sp. K12(2020)]MBX9145521.1 DUF3343 domain-containing protein [Clostridium sp. K13]MDU2290681.1 DUF3343 domain-containing protein [Clostridium celatum]MDU4325012.1 DUF3343 domain-containing protein [Clostridium celatum]